MISALSKLSGIKSRYLYLASLIALSLSYLLFQLFFIPHEILASDELWFAQHIFQYTQKTPYLDFLPYKGVIGYYLLSIPLYFSHAVLTPLFYMKEEIALLNTFFICGIGIWARKFFNPKAVLLTLTLIIINQLFLIYSTELRVDMLATWFGLISLLLILSNRTILSGIILGTSFLISQKAFWFLIATNAALGAHGLFITRSKQEWHSLLKFNAGVFITLAVYVMYWGCISSFSTVFQSLFYEAYTQSKITWYSSIHFQCWQAILLSGPLLFFLFPFASLSLSTPAEKPALYEKHLIIFVYSGILLLFIAHYQQAFPYNSIFCLPAFFISYAYFFSWLLGMNHDITLATTNKRLYFWLIIFCSLFPVSLTLSFGLPVIYLSIALLPLLIALIIAFPLNIYKTAFTNIVWITLVFTGIIYPLFTVSRLALQANGRYQFAMVRLSSEILADNGDYFAGTPILYDKTQSIAGLKNLIGPAVAYLYHPTKEIVPLLLPSLNIDQRTPQQIISDLTINPVKLYVNNYRIIELPRSIRRFLAAQYLPYWGSIYIYAPQISEIQHTFSVKYAGKYQVIIPMITRIKIDNHVINPNAIITLTTRTHTTKSSMPYRLKFVPNVDEVDVTVKDDLWPNMLKPLIL